MFDIIFIFLNSPGVNDLQEAVAEDVKDESFNSKLGKFGIFERTSYDLTIYVECNQESAMRFEYNAHVYSKRFMEKIPEHVGMVIDKIIRDEHCLVDEIQLTSDLAVIESTIFDGSQPDFDF